MDSEVAGSRFERIGRARRGKANARKGAPSGGGLLELVCWVVALRVSTLVTKFPVFAQPEPTLKLLGRRQRRSSAGDARAIRRLGRQVRA